MDSKVTFKVSLSNGETLHENKGKISSQPGELSSLNKMLEYVRSNDVRITSVCGSVNGVDINLPSAGNNPRFKAFSEGSKPIGYNIYRKWAADVVGGSHTSPDKYLVLTALYTNLEVQLWINENEPNQQYINIVDK